MALRIKNWSEFQHYKDRAPPWIKLHKGLLDNMDFFALSIEAKALLPMVWLLASETDNGTLGGDADWIAFRVRMDGEKVRVALATLIARGFLLDAADQDLPAQEKWPSRHVSAALKAQVFARDGGKCTGCSSEENIEYDHKTPVSKGGESVLDNLQLLCRPCNRRKRTSTAERVATQPNTSAQPAYSESEAQVKAETQDETEVEPPAIAVASPPAEPDLEIPPHLDRRKQRPEKTDGKFRLPADWRPDAHCRAYAQDRGLDPDATADVFTDHFTNRKGKSERRDGPGWIKRWEIWCRADATRPVGGPAVRPVRPAGGGDAFYDQLASIAARDRDGRSDAD